MKIVLDSSALISVIQEKTDVIELVSDLVDEAEFLALKQSLDEIKTKSNPLFEAISMYLQKKNVEIITGTEKKPDDCVLKLAEKEKALVVTNDLRLKARLKKLGIQVITLREKRFPRLSQ
ncbi:hypothetical protein HUU53_01165 [Candidatus Micrarchaeota archaeon]|nr:hypothetical protein [Candidatus Micrarchaeota archaeon]